MSERVESRSYSDAGRPDFDLEWRSMKISETKFLITGGSGFIGTNLVEHLLGKGFKVVNFDKNPPKTDRHKKESILGNILDKKSLQAAFLEYEPTHVVHLAARTDLNGVAASDYVENTVGVENICHAALGCPSLKRIILASSRLVNEIGYAPKSMADYNPTTEYGRSKVEGELITRKILTPSELSWAIFRPTSIWGPWFGVPYRNFFDAVKAGRYMHPKGKIIRKTFGYVGNSVRQLEALSCGRGVEIIGETMYLADRKPIEVYEFATEIAAKMGVPLVRQVDERLLRGGALFGDMLNKLGVGFPLTTFRLNNMLTEMIYDVDQICSIVDGVVEMGDAVKETVDWMSECS